MTVGDSVYKSGAYTFIVYVTYPELPEIPEILFSHDDICHRKAIELGHWLAMAGPAEQYRASFQIEKPDLVALNSANRIRAPG